MINPLPCPFCGENPEIAHFNPEGTVGAYVICVNDECPANPVVHDAEPTADDRPWEEYRDKAIERWNSMKENHSIADLDEERLHQYPMKLSLLDIGYIIGVLGCAGTDQTTSRRIIHSLTSQVAALRDNPS